MISEISQALSSFIGTDNDEETQKKESDHIYSQVIHYNSPY